MERVKKSVGVQDRADVSDYEPSYQRIWQAVRRAVNGVDRRAGRRRGKETF